MFDTQNEPIRDIFVTMKDSFTEDEADSESIPTRGPAVNYGADYTLETIAQYVKNGDIVVQPGFQRRSVWDKKKASKLIESFLLGYPVPNILLGRPQDGDKMEVIDGQQRILAISSYLKGTFKETIFKLTGDIEDKYLNKTFEDLEEVDQRRLRNQILKATILVYSDDQPDLKFSAFQRINTGSVTLTQQEIRNCIYGGSLNNFLHELNKMQEWRVYLSPKPDSRMRDEETLLRFFAALYNRLNYQKPMTKFLNDFMRDNQNADEETLDSWSKIFTNTLSVIKVNYNGNNPFSLTQGSRQLSRATFEAVSVTVAELINGGKKDFKDFTEKHAKLLSDEEFIENANTHTSDDKRYFKRFEKAMNILK